MQTWEQKQPIHWQLADILAQLLRADVDDFSLHAGVRSSADDRQALKRLCRYITCPALTNERVQISATGQVVLKLKTPWRDRTTHLVMSPLELRSDSIALALLLRLNPVRPIHSVDGQLSGAESRDRYCRYGSKPDLRSARLNGRFHASS